MKNTTVNLQDSAAGFDSQIFSGPRHRDCLPKPRFVPTFVYVHILDISLPDGLDTHESVACHRSGWLNLLLFSKVPKSQSTAQFFNFLKTPNLVHLVVQ